MSEQAMLEVLGALRDRLYGKYRGTVTEVDSDTLRIKATLQGALAGQATGWCAPCVPFAGDGVGIAFLPEVGAGVWIEFEGGNVALPIWTGCFWFDGQAPADAAASVRVIATKAGKIVFDDAGTITVSDNNNNTVTLGSDGITLRSGGSSVAVSDSEVNVNDGALEVLGG